MFEWILIALVIAAIFYAGDLPKIKDFILEKTKFVAHKAQEKKIELEKKVAQGKDKKTDSKEDSQ